MVTVLVTAVNGDVGESIGRILRECWPTWNLHGADMSGVWPGCQVFDSMHLLPSAGADDYATALETLAEHVGADLVIPVSEPEIRRLATEACGLAPDRLVMQPARLLLPFLDKQETSDWLESRSLPCPRTMALRDAEPGDLPVIAKARRGHGNRGYEAIHTPERLAVAKLEADPDWVAQELLLPADQEYTCAIVRLNKDIRTLTMRRRLDGSSTIWVRVETVPAIDALLRDIATECDLEGAINAQLRLTERGPMVFEINPRFSGTVMMRHRLGFEDLRWVIATRVGELEAIPEFQTPVGAQVFRMPREVVAPAGS